VSWHCFRNFRKFQLGSLVPEEPRLGKKLAEPLTHLIATTSAKSLLYECIMTVIAGDAISKSLLQLCLEKLRLFIEDSDQNRTWFFSHNGIFPESSEHCCFFIESPLSTLHLPQSNILASWA
jgi:hypothetical protein